MSETKIKNNKKLYFSRSPIHGYGVFADELIKKDEIIEVVPSVEILPSRTTALWRYRYGLNEHTNYQVGFEESNNQRDIAHNRSVIPAGYGMFYNHSEDPNAVWSAWQADERLLTFSAVKDIQKDEEILITYGEDYAWNSVDWEPPTKNMEIAIAYFFKHYSEKQKEHKIDELSQKLVDFLFEHGWL